MRCRRTAGAERTQSAGTAASRERTGKIVLGGFCPGSQKPCVVELCRGKAGRAGWGARHDYEGVGMSNKMVKLVVVTNVEGVSGCRPGDWNNGLARRRLPLVQLKEIESNRVKG